MIKSILKRIISRLNYKLGSPAEIVMYKKFNPHDISFGENSSIVNPLKIDGGKNIVIGDNSRIGKNAWLGTFESYGDQKFAPKLFIGDNVSIGNYACITSINEIRIEHGCLISEYVYISDHGHGYDPELNLPPIAQPLKSKGPVIIGTNTFLGFRACILPGVTLGKNCIVGANSVVTKSFPDYSMVGGVPAKLIKTYSFKESCWKEVNQ